MSDGIRPPLQNRPTRPPTRSFGWLQYLIWFFLIWIAISFFFHSFGGEKRIPISYTVFKQQVQDGNVKQITSTENEIDGEFRKAYKSPADTTKNAQTYLLFSTIKPAFEDPGLMTMLEKDSVTVYAKQKGNSWLPNLLIFVLPWILIIGYFAYASKRMKGMMGTGGLFGVGKSRAKRFRASSSNITFEDVAGLQNAKQDLHEIIDYLKDPKKFSVLGADIPKGILLMGPPGTGKTLLARASAGEANVPFFSISGSEFIEMFVGVGASRVRDMFEDAKREAPSIIFIDEIDSVGRIRGTGLGGGHDEREQTLNQILSEMDGFEPHQSVVVIAATNRPDVLDPALIRPGRFDRQITMELPQKKAREKILRIHTRHVPLSDDVDLENLSKRTVGFSGADLKNVVNEAALLAGRKDKKMVDAQDFEEARDKILLGAEREDMLSDEEKKLVAYHEAGHALVAEIVPNADRLQKVTIIPRGRSLGATEQVPEIDRHNLKRAYLLDRIAVMLGGRAAEKLVFDEISTGGADDLKQVTQLARRMICQWGMSDKLGAVTFRQGEEHPFLGRELAQAKDFSESTARIIDEEIQKIVSEMEQKAFDILKQHLETLKALAEALVEHETLEYDDVEAIVNPQKV